GNFTVTGNHNYANDGIYTFSVTLNDSTGGGSSQAVTGTATIREFSLAQSSFTATLTEGQSGSIHTATLEDPGSPDPASHYTATIDWGDGSSSAGTIAALGGGSYSITGTHTYADEGAFQATTTSFDNSDPTFFISTVGTITVLEADVLTAH